MSTDIDHDEIIEGELVETNDNALATIERAQIDVQIATAKRYPRSIKQFKASALEMATLDEDTAGSMFYVLPRGGKKIEGPSVRLAEIVGSAFGNLRYASRIVGTDDKFITAQGMCHDLEKNISASVEVKRRITNKEGRRFNDDMIQTTSNAACSIALRQAIFKVVPFAFVKSIYDSAKLTSIGKAESMAARRAKAFDWFTKAGATQTDILASLGRAGLDDVTIDDLITLRGLATAIKDGETTIEEAFALPEKTGKKVSASPLNETLKKPPIEIEPPTDVSADRQSDFFWENVQRVLDACKLIGDVTPIYDRLCGPDSELSEEDTIKAEQMCKERVAAIRASRGGKQTTLMDTNENVGQ